MHDTKRTELTLGYTEDRVRFRSSQNTAMTLWLTTPFFLMRLTTAIAKLIFAVQKALSQHLDISATLRKTLSKANFRSVSGILGEDCRSHPRSLAPTEQAIIKGDDAN